MEVLSLQMLLWEELRVLQKSWYVNSKVRRMDMYLLSMDLFLTYIATCVRFATTAVLLVAFYGQLGNSRFGGVRLDGNKSGHYHELT